MAKFDEIFKTDVQKRGTHPKRVTKWIHYEKLVDNISQYCDEKNREEIEELADLIEADGEVLQDLLVRKTDADEYEIIAGHKRRRACRLLVEERKKEEYAFLPCIVKDSSDVRAEFQVYSSNAHHEKTHYERMHELERMKHLLETYPEEFPHLQAGRMVERLAKILKTSKTVAGEYLSISNNLSDRGMEEFKKGTLKKSAAVELSGLPEKEQEELMNQGITSYVAIKEYKEQKKPQEVIVPESVTKKRKIVTVPDSGTLDPENTHMPDLTMQYGENQVIHTHALGYLVEYGKDEGLKGISERKKVICSQEKLIEILQKKSLYVVWSAQWINVNTYQMNHPEEHVDKWGL